MNIFILDECPVAAARCQIDKHCVKMVLETAQLLSTVAQLRGFEAPYKITHKNHPCSKWAGAHPANWSWLCKHGLALCDEYTRRYNKTHKSQAIIEDLERRSEEIWGEAYNVRVAEGRTPFEQCMPDEYKNKDPVVAYRTYYIKDKYKIAKWTYPGVMPGWFLA